MSNILQQYYMGITQQLRAEVESINNLSKHPGVKGNGNETALRDLITRFIPKRYGVGSGIVIDSNGNRSRQCDIVVYDILSYPSLLTLSNLQLFPVDMVHATIEVKTTLTKESAQNALKNIASVRTLKLIQEKPLDPLGSSHEPHLLRRPASVILSDAALSRISVPPLGFVFAYKSTTQRAETAKNWFVPASEAEVQNYPSIVGCLDIGLMYFIDSRDRISSSPSPGYRMVFHVADELDQSAILLNFLLHLTEMIAMHEVQLNPRLALHYLPEGARHGRDVEIWRREGWSPSPWD